MNRVTAFFKRNFHRRPDWKFRFVLIGSAFVSFEIAVFTTPSVWNTPLLVVYVLFLIFGVDIIARFRQNRKDGIALQEAYDIAVEERRVRKAKEFEDRLDKSFGLDIK